MDAKTLRETNQLLQDFIHALTLEGVHHTIIQAAVTRTLNGSSPRPPPGSTISSNPGAQR